MSCLRAILYILIIALTLSNILYPQQTDNPKTQVSNNNNNKDITNNNETIVKYSYVQNNTNELIGIDKELYDKFEETIDFGVSRDIIDLVKRIEKKKDKRFYPLLLKILSEEKNIEVLKTTIYACNSLTYKDAGEFIYKHINTNDDVLKSIVIRTLGDLGFDKGKQEIIDNLNSSNKLVLSASVYSCGKLKIKEALDKLYEIFYDDKVDGVVKQDLIISIGQIGEKDSIDFLEKIVFDNNYSEFIRMFVPTALGDIGGERAFDLLVKIYELEKFNLKIRAVEALGRNNSKDCFTILRSALKDDSYQIRIEALKAISKVKDSRFVKFVTYIINNDMDISVRKEAVKTLSIISANDYLKLYNEEINSNKYELKKVLIENMKNLEKVDNLNILKELYYKEKDKELRNTILLTIFSIGKEARQYLISILEQETKDTSIEESKLYILSLFSNKDWNIENDESVNESISVFKNCLNDTSPKIKSRALAYLNLIKLPESSKKYDEITLLIANTLKDDNDTEIQIQALNHLKGRNWNNIANNDKTNLETIKNIIKDKAEKSKNNEIRGNALSLLETLKKL